MKFAKVFERMGLLEKESQGGSSSNRHFDGEQNSGNTPESLDSAVNNDLEQKTPDEIPTEANKAKANEIDELRSLDDIYADSEIPASPFSATKLLKLLEGLNTLPEEVRKKAVMAMDAAEEDWTIEDPLLDAQRRIKALKDEHARLEQQANNAEACADAELQAQNQYEEQAATQIRQQIRELEELLEQELKTIAEARENIKAQAKAARKTCLRQQAAVEKELKRLNLVSELFVLTEADSTDPSNNPEGTTNG